MEAHDIRIALSSVPELTMTSSTTEQEADAAFPILTLFNHGGVGAGKLLDFLKQAFDAQETFRLAQPNGTVGHAEVRIGDSVVMMADACSEAKPRPGTIHLYVNDTDVTYKRALAAGATSLREPADQFYGDRSAGVQDPAGNHWFVATHKEDVAPEEMAKRAEAYMQQQTQT